MTLDTELCKRLPLWLFKLTARIPAATTTAATTGVTAAARWPTRLPLHRPTLDNAWPDEQFETR
eukprot:4535642-Amphidinium_carterae.1